MMPAPGDPIREVDTTCATLRFHANGLLEVRVKPRTRLTVPVVQEVMDAREALCRDTRHHVLVSLPDDTEVDMEVMLYDHYEGRQLEECTVAVAWNTRSTLYRTLVDAYFKYFPKQFRAKAFRIEEEAKGWLASEVD
jgi:hypothetical protein